jgi:predicted dehydrogenase
MSAATSDLQQLKAAVVGVGSLGQHHARVYTQLPGVELVGVADVNESQAKAVAHKCKCAYTTDFRDLVNQVDVVSVVVPTAHHFEVAKAFLGQGKHVLLEKPMTTTVEEADELIRLAQARQCCLQIGHIERFNEAIQELKKIIHEPRFIEVHRLGPFSKRNNDIGVVLDLMIHDLDIIMDLVGAGVDKVEAVGVKILTAHEDIANARLTLANGCVANLSASRASVETKRKIRIFSPDSYISIDYQKQELVIFKLKKDRPRDESNLLNMIDREKLTFGKKEPLMIELSAFVHAVRSGGLPEVTATHGREALAVALEITRQIREQNYTAQ